MFAWVLGIFSFIDNKNMNVNEISYRKYKSIYIFQNNNNNPVLFMQGTWYV